ncbi:MAG: FGGY-family carbohydrate kinase, partial [bacterium]
SELTKMAEKARPFSAIIEPDNPVFLPPGDMPRRIADFCMRTGQEPPQTKGELVRCVLESLALKCRWVLERLEDMLGRRLGKIHIFGGGSQNTLLCQFIADATNRLVLAGPVEATATGNALVQALALRIIKSHAEMRAIVRNSFEVKPYQPSHTSAWDEAYQRFLKLMEQTQ